MARDEAACSWRLVPDLAGGFPIATTSRPAQQWFDYGIKLFHAFYHDDARRAFDNAAQADPDCSLCLWGQALSRGPTQNFDASEGDVNAGLEMVRRAAATARTAREKLLAAAMLRRYARVQDMAAERDFAADLVKAESASVSTPDLTLLAAESLLTAWRRGDKGAASEAVAMIEPILRRRPQNTAAIHYYIHATEFAGKPELALAHAEKLPALAPKASHLVHMAGHTFLRIGRYQNAATINAAALQVDAEHLAATATSGPLGGASYYGHNLRFGMAGALMSGDGALALKFADHLHRAYPERSFARDGMVAAQTQRFVIYARYAPARMLSLPEPSADNVLTRSQYHYARGEAFATLRDAAGLAREAALVTGDNPYIRVARGVLAGRLAMLEGRIADAARAIDDAASLQEKQLTGMDPPDWWYPVRRSEAAAWLQGGQFARAAAAAQASLVKFPRDALALLVLSRAEEGLGRTTEARRHREQAIGAWEGAIAKVDIGTI